MDATCFNAGNNHQQSMIRLLAQVLLTATDLFDELLARSIQSQGGDGHDDDSVSDEDSLMSHLIWHKGMGGSSGSR